MGGNRTHRHHMVSCQYLEIRGFILISVEKLYAYPQNYPLQVACLSARYLFSVSCRSQMSWFGGTPRLNSNALQSADTQSIAIVIFFLQVWISRGSEPPLRHSQILAYVSLIIDLQQVVIANIKSGCGLVPCSPAYATLRPAFLAHPAGGFRQKLNPLP